MPVVAPLRFPKNIEYRIFGESETARHLAKILAKICPSSRLTSCSSDLTGSFDGFYVVCEANWPHQRDRLLDHGVPKTQIIEMPLPAGDSWGYWEFSKAALDRISLGDRVEMSEQDFAAFLVQDTGRAGFGENGQLNLVDNSYCCFFSDFVAEHEDQIEGVKRCLGDNRSKAAYDTVLFGRPQDQWARFVGRVFDSVQYFDYVDFDACRTVINGGVWHGCELPLLMAALPNACAVHNIDPLGYDHLSDYVRPTVSYFSGNCIEHRLAFADHDGTISFPVLPDGQASPAFAERDDYTNSMQDFPCQTVDAFVAGQGLPSVDLIKFDLEAGEVDAIPGMLETIARFRPQMAISIYHYINHLWEIPAAMMRVCENYNFYVEAYGWERFEVILYCIPAEKDRNIS